MEIWTKLYLDENYEVSSLGRIKNLKTGNILNEWVIPQGYSKVSVNKKNIYVHKAVLLSFNPPKDKTLVINHKNSIRTDNSLNNLEWITQKENAIHSKKPKKRYVYYIEKDLFFDTTIDCCRYLINNGIVETKSLNYCLINVNAVCKNTVSHYNNQTFCFVRDKNDFKKTKDFYYNTVLKECVKYMESIKKQQVDEKEADLFLKSLFSYKIENKTKTSSLLYTPLSDVLMSVYVASCVRFLEFQLKYSIVVDKRTKHILIPKI